MNILLMGPPGSGKGTQSRFLVEKHSFVQFSTGDMLRSEIEKKTSLGKEIETFISNGFLVPDKLVLQVLETKISSFSVFPSIVFDGFPRTVAQASALNLLFKKKSLSLDAVFEIRLDTALLLERVLNRFTCRTCLEGYHKKFKQPRITGVCDKCSGTRFNFRKDDNSTTFLERIDLYNKETKPVLEYYNDMGLLTIIDGNKDFEFVFQQILENIVSLSNKY